MLITLFMNSSFKAVVLFLEYDEEKTRRVLEMLRPLFERCDGFDFTLVRIRNRDPEMEWTSVGADGCVEYMVGGDNSSREFSGWDKGWESVKENLVDDFDVVWITNDALLNSKPVHELDAITGRLLRYVARTKTVVGWIDTFSRVSSEPIDMILGSMQIFGCPVRRWVCTAFLAMSPDLLDRVTPLCKFKDLDSVFPREFGDALFLPDCGLNSSYQHFLVLHQTVIWNQRYELTHETFDRFKTRNRSTINENLFGYNLNKMSSRQISLSVLARGPGRRFPAKRLLGLARRRDWSWYGLAYLDSRAVWMMEIWRSAALYYKMKLRTSWRCRLD
jgi:hypothetical protein